MVSASALPGVSAELPYYVSPPNNNVPSSASCEQISVAALLGAAGVSVSAKLAIFEFTPRNFTLLSTNLSVGR
jgi:hypothetical protein